MFQTLVRDCDERLFFKTEEVCKTPTGQDFDGQSKPRAIPLQRLDQGSPSVEKHEDITTENIALHCVVQQTIEALEALSKVCCRGFDVHPAPESIHERALMAKMASSNDRPMRQCPPGLTILRSWFSEETSPGVTTGKKTGAGSGCESACWPGHFARNTLCAWRCRVPNRCL